MFPLKDRGEQSCLGLPADRIGSLLAGRQAVDVYEFKRSGDQRDMPPVSHLAGSAGGNS